MKKKGLFIGLAVVDIVYNLTNLPPEDTKIRCDDYYMSFGGPPLKAAAIYAQNGGDATLVSSIGNSKLGKLIKEYCKEKNIKVIDIAKDDKLPSVSAIGIVKENSTRTILSGQKEIPIDIDSLSVEDIKDYDFCLYDCNFPSLTPKIIDLLKKANVELILDAGSWKDNVSYALDYANIVISSSKFISPEGEDILALQDKHNISMVAKTNNDKPIFWCAKSKDFMGRGKLWVEPLENINTLGAGDVFHGAFCFYHYHKGKSFTEALALAIKYTNKFLQTPEEERI
ncbi:MAG TPA: hypothetical protein GX709_01400 [Clostridiales bacterium]|nr:hypothetical protein [Clostridiales bacterium]